MILGRELAGIFCVYMLIVKRVQWKGGMRKKDEKGRII